MSMAAPTPVIGEPPSGANLRSTEKQMISWPDHRLLNLLGIEFRWFSPRQGDMLAVNGAP
jgi:hypothetical protein